MKTIAENPDPYIATAAEILDAEHLTESASILRAAEIRIEEIGYDNWNGGTTIWKFYLLVDSSAYSALGLRRAVLEEQINSRLQPIVEQYSTDWYSVTIAPRILRNPEWRQVGDDVSRPTRQNIFDGLRMDNVQWSGRLGEVEFLERLFDLKLLPSTDSRYKDAAGDIWQHRVNNPNDWPDDWIYSDGRFKLHEGTSENFLRFLCEVVHPVVRPDREQSMRLVQQFNDQLHSEGWGLVEHELIAGRPRFVAQRIAVGSGRSASRAKSVADALDAGWMRQEIQRLEFSVERDPALAIGTAKELVETCCKSILTKRGVAFGKSADLPELTKLLTKELKLVPDGISDQAKGAESVRLILRNLAALTHYLAELRGLYGSGHGRDGKHRGLEPRHARLAVGTAVAFIDFVTDTYHRRDADEGKTI